MEVTRAKPYAVQFIHESVREFFLKESISGQLGSELDPRPSHNRLKECCDRYTAREVVETAMRYHRDKFQDLFFGQNDFFCLPNRSQMPKASSEEAKTLRSDVQALLPFLNYALHHVLDHADTAE